MRDPLPSRHSDGHYDTCAIRAGDPCDCPATPIVQTDILSGHIRRGTPAYRHALREACGEGKTWSEAALRDLPRDVVLPLLDEIEELRSALREEMAWDMGGVPENEWIQRTRLLREAVAVAMLELERASDVRANRTKLIGKAHIILQAGMAASQ